MDEEEQARRGLIFSMTVPHPVGQAEFKQTNNKHVIICLLCGEEKREELQNFNGHDSS